MTPFTVPAPYTILPPLAVNPYPVPHDGHDVGAVQQFDQGAAQVDAFHMTQVAQENYLRITFANWLVSYQAGRMSPDAQPPQPPRSFVVSVAPPAEDGSFIDQYDCIQIGEPVCTVPKYSRLAEPQTHTAPPAPARAEVGEAMNAESPLADGLPIGFTETMPDGSQYTKRARLLPFGTVYFWLRMK